MAKTNDTKKREEGQETPVPAQESAQQPTNEQQIQRRQSSPRPSLLQGAMEMLQKRRREKALGAQGVNESGAVNGHRVLEQKIGKEQVQKAVQILQKYKQGKANLENKIIENEEWYKLRHWEQMRKSSKNEQVEPYSAWLFNSIANKHADAMDNMPAPNVLPREAGDKQEAKMLSSIIPVILDQNDYEGTYDLAAYARYKTGASVTGIFWEQEKLNGLGDISIRNIDGLNLFWEAGVTDIQKSRNLFHVELMENELLEEAYPQLKGKLGKSTVELAKYKYDDTVDTTTKSAVVDWYYKKRNVSGKQVLHYVKFVNDVVLYATENDTQPPMEEQLDPMTGETVMVPAGQPASERGLYDDGEYPFVIDALFPMAGTPWGFGYIDIAKSAQEYIDRCNQAILKNALVSAKPRFFAAKGAGVNLEEYADLNNDIVTYTGSGNPNEAIMPIQSRTLPSICVEILNNKVEELKEATGNRDVATGGTTSGVTAASAIAAMQEAGSKLSRDDIKSSYRAYRKICLMVIERIRQFYDMPRCFRITGEAGEEQFVPYSNAGIVPQHQGVDFGIDMGYRLPLFDIEVTAQKQSPYSKMSQNELALQFYKSGFFNPQMSDQALACLDMMDFDRKTFVMQKIAQNGTMFQQMMMMQQQMLMMAQQLDRLQGSNIAGQMMAGMQGGSPVPVGGAPADNPEALGGEKVGEAENTKKARQRVAESTSPT
ncbi:MAG: hypothetical protein IK954_02380 [Clostridia bacterium]|nr:hypothetical protein [Clostridia bacterium]